MTDLIIPFNDLLKPHQACTAKEIYYSIERINEFLREAYLINQRTTELLSHLRSIRRSYLSTAPAPRRRPSRAGISNGHNDQVHFTDADRDAIDAQSKSLLRDLHAAVRQLRSAEQIRQQTDIAISSKRKLRNGGGVLGRWAAGAGLATGEKSLEELKEDGERNTTRTVRESVIWFLERGLEEANLYQGEMIAVRVQREVERGKSVLHKTQGGRAGPVPVFDEHEFGKVNGDAAGIPIQEQEKERREAAANTSMDADQLQALETENQDLIKHYENKLDQMRGVEKSMIEISELQTTLSMNLNTQSAQIDQLIQDSLSTTENVGTGNKELKKASERRSIAKTVFWATCVGCSVAIVWDAII